MTTMKIDSHILSKGAPPFIVAEVGASHDGQLNDALRLVEAAHWAGADAVKFQAYTPETITLPVRDATFRLNEGPWAGYYLHDLYERAHTPRDWLPELFDYARRLGIIPFTSVFSFNDVDFCEQWLGCGMYKVASPEIVDTPLIEYAAMTNKPLIISTGMASWEEIDRARFAADPRGEGREPLFLHCVSAYPTPIVDARLTGLKMLNDEFGIAGLSDHSVGSMVPVIAVAMGAVMIEKHIKLHDDMTSPDAGYAMTPEDFKQMVGDVKQTYEAVHGTAPVLGEEPQHRLRRSLFVVKDIKQGEPFTLANVRSVRPGTGLPPHQLGAIITNVAACNILAGTPLNWDLIAPGSDEGYLWHEPWWSPLDGSGAPFAPAKPITGGNNGTPAAG